jgi:glutathione peroxidase
MMKDNIYRFSAMSLQGDSVSLDIYRAKVILIVNTASKCGFTRQYSGLQELYETFQGEGLVILGFPCNQFRQQEPGDERAIQEFCQLKYNVTFPMFSKIDVNGKNAHPLYKFLTQSIPGTFGPNIKWNFTKFLIDTNGVPVKRYSSIKKPKSLEPDIIKLLRK